MLDLLLPSIETLIIRMMSSPAPTIVRRKSDFATYQEWVEFDRARERVYDAKRRAKRRELGNQLTLEERRERRQTQSVQTHNTEHSLETIFLAARVISSSTPPTAASIELIKERLARSPHH